MTICHRIRLRAILVGFMNKAAKKPLFLKRWTQKKMEKSSMDIWISSEIKKLMIRRRDLNENPYLKILIEMRIRKAIYRSIYFKRYSNF